MENIIGCIVNGRGPTASTSSVIATLVHVHDDDREAFLDSLRDLIQAAVHYTSDDPKIERNVQIVIDYLTTTLKVEAE